MTKEQAGTLLEHLDGHLGQLRAFYKENGYSGDRVENALDEMAGLRDGMASSALSPVDAALVLGFMAPLGDASLDRSDIVEALEAIVYA